jgi:integrase
VSPLNEKQVAKLRRHPPKSGRTLTYDNQIPGAGERIPGFGVYVTAGGVVSFFLDYRTVHGRQRRHTIGRWPEMLVAQAREEASRLRVEIRKGFDPLAEKEQTRAAQTMAELADDYMEEAEDRKRASSIRNDRQMMDKIILPKLGALPVAAVTQRDLEGLNHSLKSTPYRANRVLALLSSMFSHAMKRKWRPDNPAKGIPRYHEDRRDRWLSGDEIRQLLMALDEYQDQQAADAIRLLLFTGAREGEVLNAKWDEFDLGRGVWTKPSHHTKQQRTEHVPLNRAAMKILQRLHESKRGPYLFPGENGDGPRVTLRRPWVQVLRWAGLVTVEEIAGKRGRTLTRYRPAVRLHDLRHTFASHLVSGGTSLHIVGKLLGHTLASTTQRYAHLADRALRDASDIMAQVVEKNGTDKGKKRGRETKFKVHLG